MYNAQGSNRDDRRGGRGRGPRRDRPDSRFERKIVSIKRVAKVTSGGRRLRFSAMVVVGDKKGSVGVGLGRGVDTRAAIDKGGRVAEKAMKKIELIGDTIPHEIVFKKGAAKIMLRPAKLGTGVIAGPAARAVLELAGIENVYAKVLGSNELVANTYTTFEALKQMRSARVLKKMRVMRERIGIKTEMDKEKRKRAPKRKDDKKPVKKAAKKTTKKTAKPAPKKKAVKKVTKKEDKK